MPELPDIVAYIDALEARIVGHKLERVRMASPFLLRTIDPPLAEFAGRTVSELQRVGKRIAIGVEGDLWLVLHLMIAGRLHWRPPQAKLAGRQMLAAFDFPNGSLTLTEAGSKRRAALHTVRGRDGLAALDAGGIDVFTADVASFREALTQENHTLKRALTDPRLLSGIGNAYSDEILHAAQLSPIAQTQKLKPEEWDRLHAATRSTLKSWMDRLRSEARSGFPEGVTASERKCCGFVTRIKRRTTAPAARPADACLRIGACRVC
jgi:formamidopyrimidine-DNA glycosylase